MQRGSYVTAQNELAEDVYKLVKGQEGPADHAWSAAVGAFPDDVSAFEAQMTWFGFVHGVAFMAARAREPYDDAETHAEASFRAASTVHNRLQEPLEDALRKDRER